MAVNLFPKSHKHQKKALLIGISYEENQENGTLDGSHTGILELRMMLISEFPTSVRMLGPVDLHCVFSRAVWICRPEHRGYAGQPTSASQVEADL